MELRHFSTKGKEREFAAATKHGDSVVALRFLRAQSAKMVFISVLDGRCLSLSFGFWRDNA